MNALYGLPAPLAMFFGIAVLLSFAYLIQSAVSRSFKSEDLAAHNHVAGNIIGVVGTLYAVVLGFITVIVWQQYDGTRERLALETAAVTDTWHTAVGLPSVERSRLRRDMLSYATLMHEEEWAKMRRGGASPQGDGVIMDAIDAVGSLHSHEAGTAGAQVVTLNMLNQLHDARLRRIDANRGGALSWLEWFVLLLGAGIVISLCCVFGVQNRRAHMAMIGSVAIVVASMFVLIFELQYPYRSGMAIGSAPWMGVIQHIRYMESGGAAMNMRM
ncbi:MAG: hypothetical protein NVSMB64_10590 [Candidatus Velthaea sp.]